MDDHELKCAAMGIITYMYLLDMDDPPDIEVGDLLEIGAELDNGILEATMELLSAIDMALLEMYELPINEDDDV